MKKRLSFLPTAQLFQGRDLKLLQGEASKDEKYYAKDICKKKKQKKEETEKDQRRREKEESDLKKKRSLQKQVSIMQSFLKRGKTSYSFQKSAACDSSIRKSENVCESATLSVDCTLASCSDITFENIRK